MAGGQLRGSRRFHGSFECSQGGHCRLFQTSFPRPGRHPQKVGPVVCQRILMNPAHFLRGFHRSIDIGASRRRIGVPVARISRSQANACVARVFSMERLSVRGCVRSTVCTSTQPVREGCVQQCSRAIRTSMYFANCLWHASVVSGTTSGLLTSTSRSSRTL